MSNAIELIYSQQATDFVPGRAYSNPRFFTTPRSGVSKVFLVGDWPNIRAAYENLNIPVEQLGAPPAPPPPPNALPKPAEDPAAVVIPADWKDLAWSKPNAEGLTLRGLASSLSATPILNKEHAYACIEGELARREVRPNEGDIAAAEHHQRVHEEAPAEDA